MSRQKICTRIPCQHMSMDLKYLLICFQTYRRLIACFDLEFSSRKTTNMGIGKVSPNFTHPRSTERKPSGHRRTRHFEIRCRTLVHTHVRLSEE